MVWSMNRAVIRYGEAGCWLDCLRCDGIIEHIEDGADLEYLEKVYRDHDCPNRPRTRFRAGMNVVPFPMPGEG